MSKQIKKKSAVNNVTNKERMSLEEIEHPMKIDEAILLFWEMRP